MEAYETYDTYDDSSLYYTTTDVDSATAATAALLVTLPIIFFFSLVAYVLQGIFLGLIFKKAGLAAWPAWVPVYNLWKWLEIGGQKGFWSILSLVPFVQIVAYVFIYISAYHIGLKLNKPGAFVLLAIFLTPVWLIWLAVDDTKWDESKSPAKNLATGPKPTAPTAA